MRKLSTTGTVRGFVLVLEVLENPTEAERTETKQKNVQRKS